jgi:hypothetical protein
MPAAVLFCRVSTQKQAARNESNLPTQQKRCEDWCKSESLPVIRVFVAAFIFNWPGEKQHAAELEAMFRQHCEVIVINSDDSLRTRHK